MVVRNSFATKADVKNVENKVNAVEKGQKAIIKEIKDIRKDNLSLKAEILGELQKIRDDNAAHQFSHMRINDDLDSHEKRIEKIETTSI